MENNTFYLCPRNHFQLSYPSQKPLPKRGVISKSHDLLHLTSFTPDEKFGKSTGMSSLLFFSYLT